MMNGVRTDDGIKWRTLVIKYLKNVSFEKALFPLVSEVLLVQILTVAYACAQMRKSKSRFVPRKTKVNGETYWQVSLPSKFATRADGARVRVRQRRTFRHREEA